jgi:hypothetical protein
MPLELQKGLSGSLEYGAGMNPARVRAGPPDGSEGQRNIIGGKSGVQGRPVAFRGEGTATAHALRPLDQGRLLRAEQERVGVVVPAHRPRRGVQNPLEPGDAAPSKRRVERLRLRSPDLRHKL